jgi:hypothetical protein
MDALQRLQRYQKVLNISLVFSIIEREDRVDLLCEESVARGEAIRIMDDARISLVLDLCRKGLDRSLDPPAAFRSNLG